MCHIRQHQHVLPCVAKRLIAPSARRGQSALVRVGYMHAVAPGGSRELAGVGGTESRVAIGPVSVQKSDGGKWRCIGAQRVRRENLTRARRKSWPDHAQVEEACPGLISGKPFRVR